jgi:hypothetical protein
LVEKMARPGPPISPAAGVETDLLAPPWGCVAPATDTAPAPETRPIQATTANRRDVQDRVSFFITIHAR